MASANFTKASTQLSAEALAAATLRGITGKARLHYRAGQVHFDAHALLVYAPHLQLPQNTDLDPPLHAQILRGITDGVALRLQHSHAQLHQAWRPQAPIARLIFDLLEQLRCESLVCTTRPGMRNNLELRFSQWAQSCLHNGLLESEIGLLIYTLAQMAWSRLNACQVLATTEDLIEATRAALAPALGPALAGLRQHRKQAHVYVQHALTIALHIQALSESENTTITHNNPQKTTKSSRAQAALALLLDFDTGTDTTNVSLIHQPHATATQQEPYRIYSQQYDQHHLAGSLVRSALLHEYRNQINLAQKTLSINHTRLARQCLRVLAQPYPDNWRFGEEHGYIDGSRLAQLISNPTARHIFQQEHYRPQAQCIVRFLLDCSGSMRNHSLNLAVLVDVLSRALEQAGAATEVLGFTTRYWNGGQTLQDWLKHGAPTAPGRLNALSHLIFKESRQTWCNARLGIAALLKPDLYREGIGGEAIEWACQRPLNRTYQRQILIVISDGCPMDSATQNANDPDYLERHLRQVIQKHSQEQKWDMLALGVNSLPDPSYRRRMVLDLTAPLQPKMLDDIVTMLR